MITDMSGLARQLVCVALLSLSACFPQSYGQQVTDAETRLTDTMHALPTPPGAVLVRSIMLSTGGQLPECAGRQIQALLGTDELRFDEVLDFYTVNVPRLGWQPHLVEDTARTFVLDEEYELGVSDDYDVSSIGQDYIRESSGRFQTIYLLELITPLKLPRASQCSG